jgi:hypothetical protein
MKKLIIATALTVLCGWAFAQNTGPAPQTSMEKPATTNGAKENGAMDTTGMTATKGQHQKGQGRCSGAEQERRKEVDRRDL